MHQIYMCFSLARSIYTFTAQSVIMTVHNAAEWIGEAVHSVLSQTFSGKMELSVFNDCSTVSHASIFHARESVTFSFRVMRI